MVVPAMGMIMRMAMIAVFVPAISMIVHMAMIAVFVVLVLVLVVVVMAGLHLSGFLPQCCRANYHNQHQNNARKQQIDLELLLQEHGQHVGLEEIKRQANAGKRAGDADHAKLIEVIGVGVARVVVMVCHESASLYCGFNHHS